jgi:hypothetical protein
MENKFLILIYIVFLISGFYSAVEAQSADSSVAVIEFIEGTGRIQIPESEGWLDADDSSKLYTGYKFKTLEESRAELRLENGDVVRLNGESIISFGTAIIHARTGKGNILTKSTYMTIKCGAVWAIIESGSSVMSPVADIEGNNSIYRVSVGDDGSTEVKLYKGSIKIERSYRNKENLEISKNPEDSGKTVEASKEPEYWIKELSPYQKLVVSSDGQIVYHGDFSVDDIDEKTEWVEWNKKRDNID